MTVAGVADPGWMIKDHLSPEMKVYCGVGRMCGVGRGLGVGPHLPVHGVGVGVGPDCAQYIPPVLE